MGPLTTLLKIQDLEIVLKESTIVHSESEMEVGLKTEQIKTEIENLKKEIPEKMLNRYLKVKKNGLGIAQEIQGRCKACHMVIPVGTINSILNKKAEPACPSCNVYVYLQNFNEDN